MKDLEARAELLRDWVRLAEEDLRAAEFLLRTEGACPAGAVCFHAQQAVEKYLKAVLVWRSTEFPKAHDIDHIAKLLPQECEVPLSTEQRRRLTQYATSARYPGGGEPVPRSEAEEAVSLARRVREAVKKHLPAGVLQELPGPSPEET